jgi:hypothetical protein
VFLLDFLVDDPSSAVSPDNCLFNISLFFSKCFKTAVESEFMFTESVKTFVPRRKKLSRCGFHLFLLDGIQCPRPTTDTALPQKRNDIYTNTSPINILFRQIDAYHEGGYF